MHTDRLLRALMLALAGLLLALADPAQAHLMPEGQGAVRIEPDAVFSVISLPVSALSGFDDDQDGLISLPELNRHRSDLLRQVRQTLLWRGDGQVGETIFEDLLIPHLHDPSAPAKTAQLIAMQRHRWPNPVASIQLQADLFRVNTRPLALQVRRGDATEAVVFSAHQPQQTFFQSPAAKLAGFTLLGAEHILLGWDHLLFLLTVLVAGASWRYWAAVLTSFTLAHSLTLTLTFWGWLAMPAWLAEPLIASSIVLMALDNLRRRAISLRWRAALIFGCGLIHGVGFASALQAIGGASRPWMALLGFNLGVELGQIAFVAAALGAMVVIARIWPGATRPRMAMVASFTAVGLGSLLLASLLLESLMSA